MPLWALAMLHYWRAVGEGRRGYWFLLGLDLGLLLLTDHLGIILIAVFCCSLLVTERGRRSLMHVEPALGLVLLAIVVFPHAVWLKDAWQLVFATLNELPRDGLWMPAVRLLWVIALSPSALRCSSAGERVAATPARTCARIDRLPVEPSGRNYVYFFALVPTAFALAVTVWLGRLGRRPCRPDRAAPALAVMVAAGGPFISIASAWSAWHGWPAHLPALLTRCRCIGAPWIRP